MDEEQQPLMDTMSTEEARMIWLTMLGSGWIDQDILMNAPSNSALNAATVILDYDGLLEFNHPAYTVRLRCKS